MVDSSSDAVENERGWTSSFDSGQTKSSHGRIFKHGSMQYHPVYSLSIEEANKQAQADAKETATMVVTGHYGDCSAILSESDSPDVSANTSPNSSPTKSGPQNPPVVPLRSPQRTPGTVSSADLNHSTDSQICLLPHKRRSIMGEPLNGSGEVHVNKVARKVNSTFCVLPAGTFGPRNEFEASVVALNGSGDSITDAEEYVWRKSPRNDARKSSFMNGRTVSNKLRKMPRGSMPPQSRNPVSDEAPCPLLSEPTNIISRLRFISFQLRFAAGLRLYRLGSWVRCQPRNSYLEPYTINKHSNNSYNFYHHAVINHHYLAEWRSSKLYRLILTKLTIVMVVIA